MTANRGSAGTARATILDVARAASVSRQTVSNALNYPERVAPQTLGRVHREIERLGFRPSRAARSLKQERANALGVELNASGGRRLDGVLDSFLVELTLASRRHDSHLVPFAAADHDAPLPAYQDLLASKLADAFVLTETRHDDPRPEFLRSRGVPFASFGRVWDDPSFTWWVDVDGFAGTAAAVRHLLDQGYQRIGFLGWPAGSPVGEDRRNGWRSACLEAGCLDESLQATSVQEVANAAIAAAPLVDAVGPGGALVCVSDTLAVGAWMVLRDRDLRPGRDVGLVGFDDSDLARSFDLTSIRQPLPQVAAAILDVLESARFGGPLPTEGVVYQPTVVPRSSSRTAVVPQARGAPKPSSPGSSNTGSSNPGSTDNGGSR